MSTKTTQDYLNLITSEHAQQPNFLATITAVVSVLVQIQTVLAAMIDLFDLDLTPTGNQLDIIGQWVGVSRNIKVPISGAYFTWDGVATLGWDSGVWQNPDQTAITVLPDPAYLTLINARIVLNSWDGTTEGLYEIWDQIFPQFNLMIQDNQDMTYDVVIQGQVPDALTAALITNGIIVPKPVGVQIAEYIICVDTNPLFAWDCDTPTLNGWDDASWGAETIPA